MARFKVFQRYPPPHGPSLQGFGSGLVGGGPRFHGYIHCLMRALGSFVAPHPTASMPPQATAQALFSVRSGPFRR